MKNTVRLVQAFFFVSLLAGSLLCKLTEAQQATNQVAPRVFLLDAKQLQATKERLRKADQTLAPALAKLERDAQQALTAGPFSVTSKGVTPPSGDKHDYMSQAP